MIDYQAIARRLERGEVLAHIAREVRMNRSTLRVHLKQRGLTHGRVGPDHGLSPQQACIVQLQCAGKSYQQIAGMLQTSNSVVRTQICRIKRMKMGQC